MPINPIDISKSRVEYRNIFVAVDQTLELGGNQNGMIDTEQEAEAALRMCQTNCTDLGQLLLHNNFQITGCRQSVEFAIRLKQTEKIYNSSRKANAIAEIALDMINAGVNKKEAGIIFRKAMTAADSRLESMYVLVDIAAKIGPMGLAVGDVFPDKQVNDMKTEKAFHPQAVQSAEYDYFKAVDLLLALMDQPVEQVNGWNHHWRENYFRPTYEAALAIGILAYEARKQGSDEVYAYIVKNALPKICDLLKYKSTRKIDYGYVYVVPPLKKAVLQALMLIGDSSNQTLEAIQACEDNNYTSPYNGNNYSLVKYKGRAIEYLLKQSQTQEILEPDLSTY
jgi:hypothetical protein